MIKAIETLYKGYRFRSRLEARWAVFFDTLGIAWEYELEGYDLGSVGWYLPDFFLPAYDIWVEVKLASGNRDQDANKAVTFAKSGRTVLWAEGVPSQASYTIMKENPVRPGLCRCTSAFLMPWYLEKYLDDWGQASGPSAPCQLGEEVLFPDLLAAVVAARSARF